jgi:hypothetical protein
MSLIYSGGSVMFTKKGNESAISDVGFMIITYNLRRIGLFDYECAEVVSVDTYIVIIKDFRPFRGQFKNF